jgi:hypothetical protein
VRRGAPQAGLRTLRTFAGQDRGVALGGRKAGSILVADVEAWIIDQI